MSKKSKEFKSAFDTYSVVRQVGSGGSGTVFEVRASDGRTCALKLLDASKTSRQKLKRFQNEIQFCLQPRSENIVHVLDHGPTDEGDAFYIMPFYNSTLRVLIKAQRPAHELLRLYGQILDSVEAAHLLGVCHRDIKPENLLYDSVANRIVLADFGIARFKEQELLTTVDTAPNERLANFAYAAPEQRVSGKTVDQAADIYALGLILNEIFTGQIPQGTEFRKIKDVVSDYSYLDELVEVMVRQQPEQRPHSVTKVKEQLIARGNDFIRFQQLEMLRKQIVPESEIHDPLISNPLHAVGKEYYTDGILALRLNQPVSAKWVNCFHMRASSFSVNVSSAQMSFGTDRVFIRANENFLQQAVDYFKEYCETANLEYAAQVGQEREKELVQRRLELKRQVSEQERNIIILGGIRI